VCSLLRDVQEDFEGQNIVGKILYPLLAPLTLVRRLSIPILGNNYSEDWEEGEADEVARLQAEGLVEEGGIGAGGGPSSKHGEGSFDVEDDDSAMADGNDEGHGVDGRVGDTLIAGNAEARSEPDEEEEEEDGYPWSKGFAIASCVCLPVIGGLGTVPDVWIVKDVFPLWALFVLVGVIFAIVTYQGTTTRYPPRSRCTAKVFLVFGFFASILWIYFIANELVTILNTLGILMGISNSVLGLTVLAWANSAPDTVSIVGVARSGYVQMAIGGVYAGRMFDTLVGLGLGLTIGSIRAKGGELLLSGNLVLYFSFVCLMISVLSAGIVVPLNGFKYTKKFGIFLGVIYMVWMVLAILAAVGVIQTKLI
jgi:Ca2+/Na+ antiporter